MTAFTATPLSSPSAEPDVIRASAGMPFCVVGFAESWFKEIPFKVVPFVALFAPAGVTQASTAARAKGAPIFEAERETCNIALLPCKKDDADKYVSAFIACANRTRKDKTPALPF
jgi:hypothetical protein